MESPERFVGGCVLWVVRGGGRWGRMGRERVEVGVGGGKRGEGERRGEER